MQSSYDRESGILYLRIREGNPERTEEFSRTAEVYVDVDAEGNVLGLEALSFEDLGRACEERGGKLDVPEKWGENSPDSGGVVIHRDR